MALTRPFPIDDGFPNPVDLRRAQAAMLPREGLLPDPITMAAAGVAYAGAGWTFNARPFTVITRRRLADFDLSYGSAQFANDGVVTGAWTIPAAPVSGSRIDVLWVKARDVSQGDTSNATATNPITGASVPRFAPEWGVTSGTAATTPSVPALPAGVIEIARVTTSSSATGASQSNIAHSYPYANVNGGPIYVRTIAERNAIAATCYPDQIVTLLDYQNGFDLSFRKTRSGGWRVERGAMFEVLLASEDQVNTKAQPTIAGSWATPARNNGFSSWSNGILTFAHDGLYLVYASAALKFATPPSSAIVIRKNTGEEFISNGATAVLGGVPIEMSAGQTLAMQIYNDDTVARQLDGPRTRFRVRSIAF